MVFMACGEVATRVERQWSGSCGAWAVQWHGGGEDDFVHAALAVRQLRAGFGLWWWLGQAMELQRQGGGDIAGKSCARLLAGLTAVTFLSVTFPLGGVVETSPPP